MDILSLLQSYGMDVVAIACIVAGVQAIKKYVRGAKRWAPWIAVALGVVAGACVTLSMGRSWRSLPLLVLEYAGASLAAYAVAKPLRKGR